MKKHAFFVFCIFGLALTSCAQDTSTPSATNTPNNGDQPGDSPGDQPNNQPGDPPDGTPPDLPPGVTPDADPGTATVRRRNRVEYNNTVRDLLGTTSTPADDFPSDNHSYGFDNIADVLSLSPFQIELYDRAAEQLAAEALGAPQGPSTTITLEPEEIGGDIGAPSGDNAWILSQEGRWSTSTVTGRGRHTINIKAFGQQAGNEPVQMAFFLDGNIAQIFNVEATEDNPGSFDLQVDLLDGTHNIGLALLNPLQRSLIFDNITIEGPLGGPLVTQIEAETLTSDRGRANDTGFLLWSNGFLEQEINVPEDGDYILSMKVRGQQGGPDVARADFLVDGEPVAEIEADSYGDLSLVYTVDHTFTAGTHRLGVAFTNDYWDEENGIDRNLFVDWFAFEGPIVETAPDQDSEGRQRIMICDPLQDVEQACGEAIIRNFTSKAWRRPVTDQEVADLYAFIDLAKEEGDDFEQGIRLIIRATLMSPHFLFRVELDPTPTSEQAHPLTDHQLAARISYFLWSSIPDDELRQLADEGRLNNEEVLTAQVERMLNDPRAESLVHNFGGQWLYFNALADVQPDYVIFPDYNEALRKSLQQEAQLFFRDFMFGQRGLDEMLTAQYTYANDLLADHYGLNSNASADFVEVDLEDTTRRGLLTQGSLLTVTSHPTRTSPTRRGKWVLEQLLCSPPPPPPPGVEGLLDNEDGEITGSVRDRLQAHAVGECASCHVEMDPIGFSMEHYDGIGAWRDDDNGFAIDATGQLPTGETFDGVMEMTDILSQDERLVTCATRQMFTFAMGRGAIFHDKDDLQIMEQGLRDNNLRLRALARYVVLSHAFRWRRGDGLETPSTPQEDSE